MKILLNNTITEVQIGEAEQAHNLTIFPLFATTPDSGPDYLTLSEALQQGSVTITEVNPSGSVSSLIALNRGDTAVLGLDGEELLGAKQNRVLNTTILLGAHTQLVIPVSCTEQGRWAYESTVFADSNEVAPPTIREQKMRSVHRSLERDNLYRANQQKVWQAIAKDHQRHQVFAQTGAMRDTYTAKAPDLKKYIQSFKKHSKQCGLLAFVNGKASGYDLLSRPAAYQKVHSKLVRSYALEALVTQNEGTYEPLKYGVVQDFVAQSHQCTQKEFKSVGLGTDVRLESSSLIGSALVVDQIVVHLALIAADSDNSSGRRASYHRRWHSRE